MVCTIKLAKKMIDEGQVPVENIAEVIKQHNLSITFITTDEFYLDRSNIIYEERVSINYDEPDSIDRLEFYNALKSLVSRKDANIPVVLLDRDIGHYPFRSDLDLIGIDNIRAGYKMTQHFLTQNIQRIDFFALPNSASTIDLRIGGYQHALYSAGIIPKVELIHIGIPSDLEYVKSIINSKTEVIICANDKTAVSLMNTLNTIGIKIPEEIRIAGFDDVKYAKHLGVPLTTIHQPCREIGRTAVQTMIERINDPQRPPRQILLNTKLIIRQSCGYNLL